MKLKKDQKVFIIGKSVGRSFDAVLETEKKPVPMFGDKHFGYWQRTKWDNGHNINIVDYIPNSCTGDYYRDKDIVPIESDIIPEELFEI